ncbi:MAG: glycerol dehydratase reactivase beta/small subunit family protein [Mycobacterium sp.]
MLEGGQPEKPAILVFSQGSGQLESELLAGIEEEGVPSVVERPAGGGDALSLAVAAAGRSSLSVGVGIDSAGGVCVQHDKLPQPLTELTSAPGAEPAEVRILGHNAARIVVGVPLRTSEYS